MKTAGLIIAAFIMLAITLNWFRYDQSIDETLSRVYYLDRLTKCIYKVKFPEIGNDVYSHSVRVCPFEEEPDTPKYMIYE